MGIRFYKGTFTSGPLKMKAWGVPAGCLVLQWLRSPTDKGPLRSQIRTSHLVLLLEHQCGKTKGLTKAPSKHYPELPKTTTLQPLSKWRHRHTVHVKHTSLGHRLAGPDQQKTGHQHQDLPGVPISTAELFAPQPAGTLKQKKSG